MNDNWKNIIGSVAPALATALGGPLAGIATKAIADKLLGNPGASQEEVETAIQGMKPEDLVKLKQIDMEFKTQLLNAGIKLEELSVADRDSARKREMETKDHTNRILAFTVVGSFLAMVGATLLGYAKVESVLAGTLVGYLSAKCEQVLAYYFGSSRGSEQKTELLARSQPIK